MSGYLWKYFLEDDVESFRRRLQTAVSGGRVAAGKSHGNPMVLSVGSPGTFGTSPGSNGKTRKRDESHVGPHSAGASSANVTLSRADLNKRDAFGRTILHLAASATTENAFAFATALLEQSLTDIYLQDFESGWTALHRAFYHGNVAIACAIMNRDARDALGPHAAGFLSHSGGLVKIKDREGNGPLDLFANTVESDGHRGPAPGSGSGSGDDDDDAHATVRRDDVEGSADASYTILQGDEVFTYGSNKNVSLGFGDDEDRAYPERITLKRPDHLLRRFYAEQLGAQLQSKSMDGSVTDLVTFKPPVPEAVAELPITIRKKPIMVQDVQMAKFHSAILTTDPESNLHMCGHGQGGRLGTGDERTRFHFVCIEGGALSGLKITMIALGQDHTLAMDDIGDIFSWGNNAYGQLGYALPKSGTGDEELLQLLPRQIFGPLKRETITGIAASRIHSVAHANNCLYIWGKNDGQLGIVDSDARSLDQQVTPRRVAASLFSANIVSVAAIDRATVCLLETYEVYCFANFGYAKLSFPLDTWSSTFSRQSFSATRYETTPNRIVKVTAGGSTICAMSLAGEVYSVTVNQPTDPPQNASTSTTNPTKIRGSLSQPHRIWDLRKSHMAARDVGVDQDGSIVLTTDAGSVWRRVRRAKISVAATSTPFKAKDYKFSRIPGLTRVIAVRSSAFGAYAAIRKDCQVTRTDIEVAPSSLWSDVFKLFALKGMAETRDDSDHEKPLPRSRNKPGTLDHIRRCVLGPKDAETEVQKALEQAAKPDLPFNGVVKVSSSDVVIPIHFFVLAGRSGVVRRGLEASQDGQWGIQDVVTIESDGDGKTKILFHGIDFLTAFNLVLYLYTDMVVDFWAHARHHPKMAFRYRAVRTELLKIATAMDLPYLERAVRLQVPAKPALDLDFEAAIKEESFFDDGDVLVELADDDEVLVHGAMVCRRCPFFEGLFIGRASGSWLDERRAHSEGSDVVRVDLKHVAADRFKMVLQHIYADAGDDMFDHVVADDLDAFLDIVIDVMGVANELMLDRLSQVCQRVVGRYVTVRNVCQLLNAIAPCSVTEFKDKALEYICHNLEAVLAQGYMNELDEDLLFELGDVIHHVQLRSSEVSRSGILEDSLRAAHPELEALIESEREVKIDHMMLQTRHFSTDRTGSLCAPNEQEGYASPGYKSPRLRAKTSASPILFPNNSLSRKKSAGDFMFEMDEDGDDLTPLDIDNRRHHPPRTPSAGNTSRSPAADEDHRYDSRGKKLASPSQSLSPSAYRTLDSPLTDLPTPPPKSINIGSPWGQSPSTSKLTMKDIMSQASSSRTSNMSLALAAQKQTASPDSASSLSVTPFQPKQSQKERKKRVQAQPPQRKPSPIAPLFAAAPSAAEPRKDSPWRTVQRPKTSIRDLNTSASPARPSSPAVTRSVTAPNLTMRQTVSGSTSSVRPAAQNPASSTRASVPPHAQRPSAGPGNRTSLHADARPNQHGAAAPASSVPPPSTAIRSVRHTPLPRVRDPASGSCMTDILSQQQAEKDTIKEVATARHNLHEIQLEQEFQQWWDLESRRVMEEERYGRLLAAGNETAAGGGGGRGAESRGARCRAGEKAAATARRPAGERERENAGGGRPRRGAGLRGRGRGGKDGAGVVGQGA